ncbi:MAG: hypothetical protein QOE96_3792 [Blastocatellia bacterium]|jgi:hypothetical protein|nr:hypothetical protein [Blastocatellia bacterium]
MWNHARVASQNYIRNRSVGIYLTVSPQETYSGSAICLEINGRLFVATAAHNFDGVENGATFVAFSANRSSDTPLEIISSNLARNRSADGPDLAWLEVAVASARASDLEGVSLDSVNSRPVIHPMDGYVATGFPVHLRREERVRPNHANFVVPLLIYFTAAARIDDSAIVLDYHREGLGPQGPGLIAEPHGMSGGAVWHVPTKQGQDGIWNPGRIRLIGVTTRYVRAHNELHGLAMIEWLRLLAGDVPELAESINPLIIE